MSLRCAGRVLVCVAICDRSSICATCTVACLDSWLFPCTSCHSAFFCDPHVSAPFHFRSFARSLSSPSFLRKPVASEGKPTQSLSPGVRATMLHRFLIVHVFVYGPAVARMDLCAHPYTWTDRLETARNPQGSSATLFGRGRHGIFEQRPAPGVECALSENVRREPSAGVGEGNTRAIGGDGRAACMQHACQGREALLGGVSDAGEDAGEVAGVWVSIRQEDETSNARAGGTTGPRNDTGLLPSEFGHEVRDV